MHACIYFTSQKGYQHFVFTKKERKKQMSRVFCLTTPRIAYRALYRLWEHKHAEHFC